tara:strand:- start:670 stop:978 length:309 start_codon:yes stop_codon:yes gene_type:complete
MTELDWDDDNLNIEGEKDLIMYTGKECSHCKDMYPIVDQAEKELKLTFTKKEIWHNNTNQNECLKLAEGKCDGIPFFFNKKSKKWICGRASLEKLKDWAQGK